MNREEELDKISQMLSQKECSCKEIGGSEECKKPVTNIVFMVQGLAGNINILHVGCYDHCWRTVETFGALGALVSVEVETIENFKIQITKRAVLGL